MKKQLLASTALVGASLLMAGPAAAQTKVKVGGVIDFQVGMSDQDLEGFTGAQGSATNGNDRGYFFQTDSEVRFRASGKTDAGMKWSAKIELETSGNVGTGGGAKSLETISHTDIINLGGTFFTTLSFTTVVTVTPFDESVIDEVQITFSGSWGRLILGNEDGAEDLLHVSSEHAVDAGTGGAEGDWEDYVNGTSVSGRFVQDPTLQRDSSDHTKITYFTPRINGLQLGVSYVPDLGAAGLAPTTDDDGNAMNFWGFGANYKQKFGDFSVRVGAVGAISEHESDDKEGIRAWEVGAVVGWGPVKIGGSYQDNSDSLTTVGSTVGDSTAFDIGIGYSQGPILLGLNWLHSEVGTVTTDDHEQEVVTLGATYKLGKGVVVYAEGFWVDFDSATDDDEDNEAYGLILGTTVRF